jgi:hypothetical protein
MLLLKDAASPAYSPKSRKIVLPYDKAPRIDGASQSAMTDALTPYLSTICIEQPFLSISINES